MAATVSPDDAKLVAAASASASPPSTTTPSARAREARAAREVIQFKALMRKCALTYRRNGEQLVGEVCNLVMYYVILIVLSFTVKVTYYPSPVTILQGPFVD